MENSLRTDLIEYEKICEVLKSRQRDRGMDFFIPNPLQRRALSSPAQIVVMCTGNRAGKTTAGAYLTACHITKKYPDYVPKNKRFKGPLKIRISTDNFNKIDNVIEPKLRQYVPRDEWVKVRKSPQGYTQKIWTKDGSAIEFLTMEQDALAFEGQDIDFFWGDEPQDRARYIATQRGLLDRHGHTFLSFTPLMEPWMKDEIVDRADGKAVDVVTGTTRDNLKDVDGNQILNEEDIAIFEGQLTEEEREARISGKFFHLRGIVYKEFSEVHLVNDFEYQTGYPVICALDPHDRLPHHVVWAMIDRVNDIYIMHEYIKHCTTKELATTIRATERYFGWNVVKRLIDPNFGRKPSFSTNLNMIDELSRYGANFTEAKDAKDVGILKVKDYLHYNKNVPIDINNRPKLYFVRDRVPKTILSMRNLQHAEWKSDKDRDAKEDIKQKDAHGADVVRYICIDNPVFEVAHAYQPDYREAIAY